MKARQIWPVGTLASIPQLLQTGPEPYVRIGLDTLQLRLGDSRIHDRQTLSRLRQALGGFPVATAAAGWPGPAVWNFTEGPATLGLVPEAYRAERTASLLRGLEVASELTIPLVQTHFGFVPEEPSDPRYPGVVDCLRTVAARAASLGVVFCLETGQETPVTLRRLIEDAGSESVGVNLDTANLLLYGKGNPADAVDILGSLIRSLHVKDGEYPADMYRLGTERPVGQGRADVPGILKKLRDLGFDGPLIIEREITGPQQWEDIAETVRLLRQWMDPIG